MRGKMVSPVKYQARAPWKLVRIAVVCAIVLVDRPPLTRAQTITVDTRTGAITNTATGETTATVDRRYQQITPTNIPLPNNELDAKTRLELIRLLQAGCTEQGLAPGRPGCAPSPPGRPGSAVWRGP